MYSECWFWYDDTAQAHQLADLWSSCFHLWLVTTSGRGTVNHNYSSSYLKAWWLQASAGCSDSARTLWRDWKNNYGLFKDRWAEVVDSNGWFTSLTKLWTFTSLCKLWRAYSIEDFWLGRKLLWGWKCYVTPVWFELLLLSQLLKSYSSILTQHTYRYSLQELARPYSSCTVCFNSRLLGTPPFLLLIHWGCFTAFPWLHIIASLGDVTRNWGLHLYSTTQKKVSAQKIPNTRN